jgi:hypothetical protein
MSDNAMIEIDWTKTRIQLVGWPEPKEISAEEFYQGMKARLMRELMTPIGMDKNSVTYGHLIDAGDHL